MGFACSNYIDRYAVMGKNMMWFTDWFIDYFPMYNRFRTVSSILVVAEFCMPLLAVLALKKIFDDPRFLKEKNGGSI